MLSIAIHDTALHRLYSSLLFPATKTVLQARTTSPPAPILFSALPPRHRDGMPERLRTRWPWPPCRPRDCALPPRSSVLWPRYNPTPAPGTAWGMSKLTSKADYDWNQHSIYFVYLRYTQILESEGIEGLCLAQKSLEKTLLAADWSKCRNPQQTLWKMERKNYRSQMDWAHQEIMAHRIN